MYFAPSSWCWTWLLLVSLALIAVIPWWIMQLVLFQLTRQLLCLHLLRTVRMSLRKVQSLFDDATSSVWTLSTVEKVSGYFVRLTASHLYRSTSRRPLIASVKSGGHFGSWKTSKTLISTPRMLWAMVQLFSGNTMSSRVPNWFCHWISNKELEAGTDDKPARGTEDPYIPFDGKEKLLIGEPTNS